MEESGKVATLLLGSIRDSDSLPIPNLQATSLSPCQCLTLEENCFHSPISISNIKREVPNPENENTTAQAPDKNRH